MTKKRGEEKHSEKRGKEEKIKDRAARRNPSILSLD